VGVDYAVQQRVVVVEAVVDERVVLDATELKECGCHLLLSSTAVAS